MAHRNFMQGDLRPHDEWYTVINRKGEVYYLRVCDWKPKKGKVLPKKILDELEWDWDGSLRVLWVCEIMENGLLNTLEEDEDGIRSLENIIEKCLKMKRPKQFAPKKKIKK